MQKENPHYLSFLDLPVGYQLGLADIVVPGDVRNDLYITLVSGEFARMATKTSDRNVEVTAEVCNNEGKIIPVSIIILFFNMHWQTGSSIG